MKLILTCDPVKGAINGWEDSVMFIEVKDIDTLWQAIVSLSEMRDMAVRTPHLSDDDWMKIQTADHTLKVLREEYQRKVDEVAQ